MSFPNRRSKKQDSQGGDDVKGQASGAFLHQTMLRGFGS